jgi:hypothetical protein
MVRRDPLLRSHVTKNTHLLQIIATHDLFYQLTLSKSHDFFRSL